MLHNKMKNANYLGFLLRVLLHSYIYEDATHCDASPVCELMILEALGHFLPIFSPLHCSVQQAQV